MMSQVKLSTHKTNTRKSCIWKTKKKFQGKTHTKIMRYVMQALIYSVYDV